MADVDRIIEELLGSRRISEGAAFSTHAYTDQPLIERGRDFKARIEQREAERAARRQRQAEARRAQTDARRNHTQAATPTQAPHHATPPQAAPQAVDTLFPIDLVMRRTQPRATRSEKAAPGPVVPATSPTTPSIEPFARPVDVEQLPEPIRKMRALEHGIPTTLAYGSSAATTLFYLQAELMASYEDDYPFDVMFSQYYPTYAAMSNRQLRSYYSWRTRVRAGNVGPAPLSFAFVYVYELLSGIGTTPGPQGLHDLRAFGDAYRQANDFDGPRLHGYLRRWTRDYLVYHDLTQELATEIPNQVGLAVLTLLRAEHAHLARMGRTPRVPNSAAAGEAPTPHELFEALGAASSYHLCEARLAKDEPALLEAVACDVFYRLVEHCAKRRKTDYVEGLFGYPYSEPYTMFSAAVFYEEEPHPDVTVEVSPLESFTCSNGRWRHTLACDASARSKELGTLMHAVDHTLREELSYAYPLKARELPKYLAQIVRKSVAACLQERAEQERRRITIDRTKLGSIRAAAALTQEALLTDEDRDEAPTTVPEPPATASAPPQEPPAPASPPASAPPEAPQPTSAPADPPASAPPSPAAEPPSGPSFLTPLEARVLAGLMEGTPVAQLLGPTDPFASVVVDGINEKFFDVLGDAIVEFEDDEPRIIDEYRDDIREVLAS